MRSEQQDAESATPPRQNWIFACVLVVAILGAASSPWVAREGAELALGLAWLAVIAAVVFIYRTPPSVVTQTIHVTPPAPTSTVQTLASAERRELESLRVVQHELLAAKHSAEAATMAKGEFLATMSHEIRTPLNGIVPLLDLLRTTPLRPDQREYLVTAHQSALELLRIVDDILDYSKLEASKLELEDVGINLKELVDSIVLLMESSANAKGLGLVVQIDPAVRLAVRGDPVRLRQVLTNLISNAIKFTERGKVTIHLGKRGESRDHHNILFGVRDTGIGLDPATAEKLFKPFSQADASTTRLYGGTGLGLVICKRLVDLMGGTIGVRSELGRGSLFWFNLPLQKAIGDVRVRRDLEGVNAMVLSADDAFTRRAGRMLGSFGMHMLPTQQAVDSLSKLRASAGMGERWRHEVLLIDLPSTQPSSVSLIRNIRRNPALDSLHIICFGGDDALKSLHDVPRISSLPFEASDNELRALLNERLGVDGEPVNREMPLFATDAGAEPDFTPAPPEQLVGRVLLVEDNPVNTRVAQRLLGLLGLDVTTANNGEEALAQIAENRFDIVLMDCQMPIMDGYTASRTRREQEARMALPRLPIIAMTANAMAGDREKCIEAGMDEYLSKPLDRHLLTSILSHWLSVNGQRAAMKASRKERTRPAEASQADPVATEPPAIDRRVLQELLDVMGTESAALIRVFFEDAPLHIARMQDAAEKGDAIGVAESAHALKSSSANLGALALSELAQRTEYDARIGDASLLPSLSKNIALEFQRTKQALEAMSLG